MYAGEEKCVFRPSSIIQYFRIPHPYLFVNLRQLLLLLLVHLVVPWCPPSSSRRPRRRKTVLVHFGVVAPSASASASSTGTPHQRRS